ncbi:hypothetical protein V4Y02_23580, partial [Escherichia coli]
NASPLTSKLEIGAVIPLMEASILPLRRKPAFTLSWQKKEKQQELQKSGVTSRSYLKLPPFAFCMF